MSLVQEWHFLYLGFVIPHKLAPKTFYMIDKTYLDHFEVQIQSNRLHHAKHRHANMERTWL
jgi:hypothetical protein